MTDSLQLTYWQQILAGVSGYSVEPLRNTEVAEFYWRTDIQTPEISLAFCGGAHANVLVKAAGPALLTGCVCKRCGDGIYVFSRNNAQGRVQSLKEGDVRVMEWASPFLCTSCSKHLKEAQQAPYLAQRRQQVARERELQFMPYRDYLQTPEWRSKREAAVKRAGGCCQVCSNRERLNVHHRTYVRRGAERSSDLIVLCEPCHSIFHANAKLAENGRAA